MQNYEMPTEYTPTVFDNFSDTYKYIDRNTINLHYWDTAIHEGKFSNSIHILEIIARCGSVSCFLCNNIDTNQKRFRIFRIFPGVELFLLSFSCGSDSSMESLISKWFPECIKYCPNIILVCTKTDLRNEKTFCKRLTEKFQRKPIGFEQGELLARKMGCITYLETSSFNNEGIKELTEIIAKSIVKISSNSTLKQKKCMLQ